MNRILVSIILLFVSTDAFAGGGDAISQSVNLVIFVALIVFLTRKPIMNGLKLRSNTIKRNLDTAQKELSTAQNHHDKIIAELDGLADRIKELEQSTDKQIETMRAEMEEKTARDAAALQESAKRSVADEISRAKSLLKQETAEAAIGLATDLIKNHITNEDHKRLSESFNKAVQEAPHVK
ncbi:MAG: ATP synthase F0 subunit B [Myxococcota bacterium]|nr:ATP synthase F0 subunit B [Myxococcota bacterium]